MKKSVVHADGTFDCLTAPLQGKLEDVAPIAAKIGYDAIQLTIYEPAKQNAEEIRNILGEYGLLVSSIATGLSYTKGGLCIASGDEDNRKKAVQRMKEYIDLACILDKAKVSIGVIRGWTADSSNREEYDKQLYKSMQEILSYAAEREVVILLEQMNHNLSDVFVKVEEAAEYVRKFESPYFKLQLDSIHIHYENEDGYTSIIKNKDLIGQVDISDVDRMCPDGDHFDFSSFIQALKEINYKEYLVFEYRMAPPHNAALIGFDYINKLISEN
ncbi:MAG TPA: sugar phosphate isomerase/epimerase family protein [Bacillota bacterium]|nr:sugar phosphate isomerase/epimerase family protein [Bacillota bacterium]